MTSENNAPHQQLARERHRWRVTLIDELEALSAISSGEAQRARDSSNVLMHVLIYRPTDSEDYNVALRSEKSLGDRLQKLVTGYHSEPAKAERRRAMPPFAQSLGLERWPATVEQVRAAFRSSVHRAHPDSGGSNEAFVALKRDYDEAMTAAAAYSARRRWMHDDG